MGSAQNDRSPDSLPSGEGGDRRSRWVGAGHALYAYVFQKKYTVSPTP